MAGLDTNRGAKRAREARERYGLSAAEPVACVLTLTEERAGVPVIVAGLPEGVAGVCWRGDGEDTLVWVNGAQAVVRQRFTVAHELGHVCCGHHHTAVDSPDTISGRTRDPREVQANAFAAELLMPRAGVAEAIAPEPDLEAIVLAAAHFGVSAIAMLYRCNTVGRVGTERSERLKAEIEDDLQDAIYERLAPPLFADVLAGLDEHPRLPPAFADSALAAALRGDASVDAAARAAGCTPTALGSGLAGLGA